MGVPWHPRHSQGRQACDYDKTHPFFVLQACADSITHKAKKNQRNREYLSPFAKEAQAQGINFMGGKEDDTTLLLASVSLIPDDEKAQEKDEL